MGTLIAWVLVRDEFPGKRVVNALIDLPFALPTIVASIVLLSLYGPNSPIGVHLNATQPGLVVALAFVTLPFVVRSVQPVLIEADREVEEAAASLGREQLDHLPPDRPADPGAGDPQRRPGWRSPGRSASTARWCSSAATSRARRRSPRSTSSSRSRSTGRSTPPRCRSRCCSIAFVTLFVLRVLSSRAQRREEQRPVRTCPRHPAHAARRRARLPRRPAARADRRHPVAHVRPGLAAFVESITTPAAISALNLSLLIVAIVVPVNVVFGVVTALALVRGRFRRRGVLQAIVDLPFAVSPIVVGVALILLWGAGGWFGGARQRRASR